MRLEYKTLSQLGAVWSSRSKMQSPKNRWNLCLCGLFHSLRSLYFLHFKQLAANEAYHHKWVVQQSSLRVMQFWVEARGFDGRFQALKNIKYYCLRKILKSTPKLGKYFFLQEINYNFFETCILNKNKYFINNHRKSKKLWCDSKWNHIY